MNCPLSLRQTFLASALAANLSACNNPYYSADLDSGKTRSDLEGVPSMEICDGASYFFHDAPGINPVQAKRLLAEVLRRGDITKADYDSALDGEIKPGMSVMGATCAWGLPDKEESYIAEGHKLAIWTYDYDEFGFDTIEFVDDRVFRVRTDRKAHTG